MRNAALAAQIAVAVQNAGLHEDLKKQEAEQKRARKAENIAARRLSALYEISRSFAHSLSLDETLDAIAIAGQIIVGRELGAGRAENAYAAGERMIWLSVAVGAVFVLRRRPGYHPLFRVPGYPVVPAIFILATVLLLGNAIVDPASRVATLAVLAVILLGIPVYFLTSPSTTKP